MTPPLLVPTFAAHAIDSFVLGLAIAFLAGVLLQIMRRHNPSARFAVLYSALLAIVAAFFLRGFELHSAGFYSSRPATVTLSAAWAIILLCAWAVVASAGLTRIAIGLLRLRALRRSFVPLDLSELSSVLHLRRAEAKRRVQICHSSQVRVPTAVGFFKPAVVLPSWSLDELSSEELRHAILHELAHVDRWDDWTNLGQKLIRALFFFHPAVWWIDGQLGMEREMSCDDAVLAQSPSPNDYAQCLVALAEKSFVQRQLALAQAAVGHVKQTAMRIGRILDGRSRKPAPIWKSAVAASALFAGFGMMVYQRVPQLVAFRTPSFANHVPAASRPSPKAVATALRTPPVAIQAVEHSPTASPRVRKITKPHMDEKPAPELLARNSPVRNSTVRNPTWHAPAINASAKGAGPPEFMYVVMQTRDYDAYGMVKVTTSVWRVRLTTSGSNTESATRPHST